MFRISVMLPVVVASLLPACGGHVDLGSDDRPDSAISAGDSASLPSADTSDTASPPTIDSGVDAVDTAAPPCPPIVFAGIASVDGITENSVQLHWSPASDGTTSPGDFTYSVFVTPDPGVFDFTKPAASIRGVTSTDVGGLASSTTYRFVVRAKGAGGCMDGNVVSMTATTIQDCRFNTKVQPIFNRSCAVSGCHVLPTPPGGLNLSSGFSYDNLVGVASTSGGMLRVKPYDSENSYLYRVITGRPATGTSPMPPAGATTFPTAEEKDLIKCWIDMGAKP